jgi:hypothetical protein
MLAGEPLILIMIEEGANQALEETIGAPRIIHWVCGVFLLAEYFFAASTKPFRVLSVSGSEAFSQYAVKVQTN